MGCGVTVMTQRRYPVLVETSEGRKSAGFSAPVTEEPARIALRIRERGSTPYKVRFNQNANAWVVSIIDWNVQSERHAS